MRSAPSFVLRALSVAAALALAVTPTLLPMDSALAEPDTKDAKVAEREKINERLERLRFEIDDVSVELQNTYLALAETEMLIPDAQEILDDARAELAAAQEEDRKIGERLKAAEQEEDRLTQEVEQGRAAVDSGNEELASVALESYKGGGVPNPATVYVGSTDPQDSVDRMVNYRLTMSSQGAQLDALREQQSVSENSADRLTAVREEIDALKAESEATVRRMEEAEQKAKAAKDELDSLYEKQKAQRDALEAAKKSFEGQRSQLEAQQRSVNAEIDQLVAEERTAAEQGAPGATAVSGEGWVRPVNAPISSSFGYRVHPIFRTRKLHAGVDFPVGCGVPVRAMESGKVLATTYNRFAGNKLILSHGMHGGKVLTTSYHHLQGFAVSSGQTITKGQVVGYVGTTGSSTGCHLHFETHLDGTPVNPANYI